MLQLMKVLQRTVPLLMKFLGPVVAAIVWLVRLVGGLRAAHCVRPRMCVPRFEEYTQVFDAMRAHGTQAKWCARLLVN